MLKRTDDRIQQRQIHPDLSSIVWVKLPSNLLSHNATQECLLLDRSRFFDMTKLFQSLRGHIPLTCSVKVEWSARSHMALVLHVFKTAQNCSSTLTRSHCQYIYNDAWWRAALTHTRTQSIYMQYIHMYTHKHVHQNTSMHIYRHKYNTRTCT